MSHRRYVPAGSNEGRILWRETLVAWSAWLAVFGAIALLIAAVI